MPRTPSTSRKRPANLSVRADLLERAREHRLNLSEILEQALERVIRDRERAAWLERNEDAIAGYNERVAEHGVFGDEWRRF